MTRYTEPHTPTLWSTLAEIWDISRAIWADYRDCARAARRQAQPRTGVIFTRACAWHNDALVVAIVVLAWVCAVLSAADVWGEITNLLSCLGGWL